jgi:hypothetical protein
MVCFEVVMNLEVTYCEENKDWTIFWPADEEENNKEIAKWCCKYFHNRWENGIKDLHYIRLFDEKDVTFFVLKWS